MASYFSALFIIEIAAMSFLGELVNEFTHSGGGQQRQQRGVPPPPQVPPPWRAMWDAPAGRYIFINEQTGQRTFDFPQQYAPQSQYGGVGGYGGNHGQQYPQSSDGGYRGGNEYGQGYEPRQPQQQQQHHYGEM